MCVCLAVYMTNCLGVCKFPTVVDSLGIFAAYRYFEEFEKRIPRAEMENMEVDKQIHFSKLK